MNSVTFPNIIIKLGYISGFSQEFSQFEIFRRFNSPKLTENIAWIEFKYLVPVLNKDLKVTNMESIVRYVVGAEIDLKEFKKILDMNCLNLKLESDFENKIKCAKSVCLVRTLNAKSCLQQVLVLDDNTKLFDTVPDLVIEAKKFIIAINNFYSVDISDKLLDDNLACVM